MEMKTIKKNPPENEALEPEEIMMGTPSRSESLLFGNTLIFRWISLWFSGEALYWGRTLALHKVILTQTWNPFLANKHGWKWWFEKHFPKDLFGSSSNPIETTMRKIWVNFRFQLTLETNINCQCIKKNKVCERHFWHAFFYIRYLPKL